VPIEPTQALGATLPARTSSWTADDVILYHLGIGAGIGRATDVAELRYLYEPDLSVLPSFGVTPAFGFVDDVNTFPGVAIDYSLMLHGEQELLLHRAIPADATVTSTARVAELWDKGKAAVIVIEVTSGVDGDAIFTNRYSLFARSEGGFGGSPGPSSAPPPIPDRSPDAVVASPTVEHQALIYRLSGDKNPLHADPSVARAAGFDRPILHGLSSYGVVCKAVVDGVLGGDTQVVRSYRARFAGVVYPGETIVTSMWAEDDEVVLTADTLERGTPVLRNAVIRSLR
jgi:acyl dehydratase